MSMELHQLPDSRNVMVIQNVIDTAPYLCIYICGTLHMFVQTASDALNYRRHICLLRRIQRVRCFRRGDDVTSHQTQSIMGLMSTFEINGFTRHQTTLAAASFRSPCGRLSRRLQTLDACRALMPPTNRSRTVAVAFNDIH